MNVWTRCSIGSRQRFTLVRRQCLSTQSQVDRARDYCVNLLQKYDLPSFLVRPYVPRSAQDAFIAIHAFNIETARVADATTQPSIGSMRMQFWRDSVTKALNGSPPNSPVAVLLASATETLHDRTNGRSKLSKNWLHRIISAREKQLGNRPYPSLAALETYAENTYSSILYLCLSAMPLSSITADHLASHIGKATGIAAVLRGLPLVAFPPPPPTHHASKSIGGPIGSPTQGAVLLPLDIMAQSGVQEEQVLRQGPDAPQLKDAVFSVATRANDHIITAREMLANLKEGTDVGHAFEHTNDPEREYAEDQGASSAVGEQLDEVRRAFPVLMMGVSTSLWLEKLQKADFDVFDRRLRHTDWRLPWRLYKAHWRKDLFN